MAKIRFPPIIKLAIKRLIASELLFWLDLTARALFLSTPPEDAYFFSSTPAVSSGVGAVW